MKRLRIVVVYEMNVCRRRVLCSLMYCHCQVPVFPLVIVAVGLVIHLQRSHFPLTFLLPSYNDISQTWIGSRINQWL